MLPLLILSIALASVSSPTGISRQALVVKTTAWTSSQGLLQCYERSSGTAPWRPVGPTIPVVVGRNGLGRGVGLHPEGSAGFFPAGNEASKRLTGNESAPAAGKENREGSGSGDTSDHAPVKREGDGRAPAGIFSLSGAFGSAPPGEYPWLKLPYYEAQGTLKCIDDPRSRHYNRLVDAERVAADWSSCEDMRRADEQYRLGIVVGHNPAPAVPGLGSCIFIHIWKNPESGTAGCTAMSPENMEMILRWLDPAAFPVLIQLPEAAYRRLRFAWELP